MTTIDFTVQAPGRTAKCFHFEGPATWQEVSARQAIGLTSLRLQVREKPELLFAALELLYGFKAVHQRWLFDEAFLRQQGLVGQDLEEVLIQGQALLDTIRWVGEQEPGIDFIVKRFRLHDFQYGTLRVLWLRLRNRQLYWGPDEGLSNCSFEEFMKADKAYQQRNLVELAAVLYRPKYTGEDPTRRGQRIDAGNKALTLRTAQFAALSPALLELIGLQYESCLRYFQRVFPLVFSGDTSGGSKRPKSNWLNWLEIAIGMAKMDATKIHQIEQLNVYLALKVLDEQMRQVQEMEQQAEQFSKHHKK